MTVPNPTDADRREWLAGLGYALAAYGSWAFLPAFWKLLAHVSAPELVVQRIVWAPVAFGLIIWLRGRGDALRSAFKDRRALATLALSATLLAVNWLAFLYAVTTDRVLHASLGYFINPLVNVLLGMLLLGERMRRWQWLAVVLATCGVVLYATRTDGVPWISLVLAGSFGLYGFLRKTVRIDALPGSTVEMLLLILPAISFGLFLEADGRGHFGHADAITHVLFVTTGAVTALPLLWFANGVRRLPLTTIAFLQYLGPSGQFLLAVFAYDEHFGPVHLASFAAIWAGLLVFSADAWRQVRASRRAGSE